MTNSLTDSLILPLLVAMIALVISIAVKLIFDFKLWRKVCYLERLIKFSLKKYHPDFDEFEELK